MPGSVLAVNQHHQVPQLVGETMIYAFGDCEFHSELYTLTRAGQQIHLRPKVYRTLTYLIEHRDRVVSKDELGNSVWDGRFVSNTTIESTVKAVRRAAGDSGEVQRVIKTLTRQGYRFVAPIESISTTQQVAPSPKDTPLGLFTDQTGGFGDQQDTVELVDVGSVQPECTKRQLTVMFCGVRLTTKEVTALDSEDRRDAIRSIRELCDPIIRHYEGYLSQVTADGLWVYFSYPRAQEDAACRAVSAGLEIIAAVKVLKSRLVTEHGIDLIIRVGIHTGQALAGGATPKGDKEQLTLDDTPSIAARLQLQGDSDTVIITEPTLHLVDGFFVCSDLGQQTVSDTAEPVTCYRVERASGVNHRLDLQRPQGLTPLVHREVEIALLKERCTLALAGSGHIALISGEAGIGKSRLARALCDAVTEQEHLSLIIRSSPYHRNSPFYPIVELLQKLLLFRPSDSSQSRLKKLERALRRHSYDLPQVVPLFAPMLSIPILSERYPLLEMSPQRQREKTIETMIVWLIAESRRQPMLIVWEDLHWVDASSLDLFNALMDHVPSAAIFAMLTFRLEFKPPFPTRSFVASIVLPRLAPEKVADMIAGMLHGKAVPPQLVSQVAARSDGVPLFVEEYTKMALEFGWSEQEDGRVTNETPDQSIPTTLQDALTARFDRFDPGAAIARIGAVFGREFAYETIGVVAPLDDITLRRGLAQLVDAELLYQTGFLPKAEYRFKHALVQDAAYQSLLKKDRKRYHRKIARILEEQFTNAKTELLRHHYTAEVIAHHYESAGDMELAAAYWLKAGQRSIRLAGYVEAIAKLNNAYRLVLGQEESTQRDRTELDIITALGAAHAGAGGFSGNDAGNAYNRARALCTALDYPPETFNVLSGAGSFEFMRGNYSMAREIAVQSIELAGNTDNPTGHVIGNRLLGAIRLATGEFDTAIDSLKTAIDLYEQSPELHHSYALDHKTTALCYLAYATLAVGRIDTALAAAVQSLAHAEHMDRHSLNYALCYLAGLHHVRGDNPDTILNIATRSLNLALEEGYATWVGMSRAIRGEASIRNGTHDEGLSEIKQGIDELASVQMQTFLPFAQSMLVKGYLAADRPHDALSSLKEAEALTEKTEQRWYLPELQRLHAETLALQGDKAEAHDWYRKALNSAAALGAKFWNLKISMSFARFLLAAGRPDEAYRLLLKADAALEEGHDAPVRVEVTEWLRRLRVAAEQSEPAAL